MRRLCYYANYIPQFWPTLFLAPLGRWIEWRSPQTTMDGIKIIDISLRAKVDERFLVDTSAALHLIKSVDLRRYRRIQRQIKRIVNSESYKNASYSRPEKTCDVDYGRIVDQFNSKDREWYLWLYAITLVHEATHGAIFSRQIHYTSTLRGRIERLCHTEEKRFAKRSDTRDRQWSETLVGPFDESL